MLQLWLVGAAQWQLCVAMNFGGVAGGQFLPRGAYCSQTCSLITRQEEAGREENKRFSQ